MTHSSGWRSPNLLPRPVDAGKLAFPDAPRERLLLSVAWRSRSVAQGLGHALARVPGGEPARGLLARISHALTVSDAFTVALAASGHADAELLVQARLAEERLPRPESWAETAMLETTMVAAGLLVLRSLGGSSDAAVSLAAASAGAAPAGDGARLLDELAADQQNRPCLQLLVDRWLPSSVLALGRPGSPGALALLGSGVMTRSPEALAREFLAQTSSRLAALGLTVQGGERMGLVFPPEETSP